MRGFYMLFVNGRYQLFRQKRFSPDKVLSLHLLTVSTKMSLKGWHGFFLNSFKALCLAFNLEFRFFTYKGFSILTQYISLALHQQGNGLIWVTSTSCPTPLHGCSLQNTNIFVFFCLQLFFLTQKYWKVFVLKLSRLKSYNWGTFTTLRVRCF